MDKKLFVMVKNIVDSNKDVLAKLHKIHVFAVHKKSLIHIGSDDLAENSTMTVQVMKYKNELYVHYKY